MQLIRRFKPAVPGALLIATAYLCIIHYALPQYINWRSAGFLLGLVAIPVVLTYNPQQKRSLRFYYAALACCLLAWIAPVKTLLFAALVMAVCFLADNVLGKINSLPLLAIGLMAPIFEYITTVFTFPIRLLLTRWAAGLLQVLGLPAVAEGNTILYHGKEFAVDPACMGLGMMVTAMLSGLMLLGFFQKKYGRQLPFGLVCALLAAVGGLNVLSNLFRMLLLVLFSILPGNPMHGVTGIICLAVYVLAPLVWGCPHLVRRFGRAVPGTPAKEQTHRHVVVLSHICLAACIFLVAYKTNLPAANAVPSGLPSIPGYTCRLLGNQVIKAENGQALVYLKPTGGFYRTDHNPTICWQGSGFEFRNIKETVVAGRKIYTGILQKGAERLHTAWWYDNGNVQTIAQWEWRWNTIYRGHRYMLVNVTAANETDLVRLAGSWLQENRNNMKWR